MKYRVDFTLEPVYLQRNLKSPGTKSLRKTGTTILNKLCKLPLGFKFHSHELHLLNHITPKHLISPYVKSALEKNITLRLPLCNFPYFTPCQQQGGRQDLFLHKIGFRTSFHSWRTSFVDLTHLAPLLAHLLLISFSWALPHTLHLDTSI